MLTGMLIGAAAASLVLLGWAASQFRWLAAHCGKQIAYWREEAERARRNSLADSGQRTSSTLLRMPGNDHERMSLHPVSGALPVRVPSAAQSARCDPCGHAAQHRTFHTVPPGE